MKVELKVTGKTLAAAVVVFLGVVLAMATTIARGTGAGPVNAPALVQTIVKEEDHVTPGELARWIIEKRTDYQLIDIRQPWQFDDYHIPAAVSIPLSQLFEEAGLKQLSREKKIVVYGLGAGHAAEAQLLLSLKGYNAYSLREGVSAWWDEVITPMSLRSESASPTGYLEAKQLREYFLGRAPAAGTSATIPPPVPEVPPAGTAPGAPAPTKKLKLGRGCS
jgi:rhodanese-related sulfurtransferase